MALDPLGILLLANLFKKKEEQPVARRPAEVIFPTSPAPAPVVHPLPQFPPSPIPGASPPSAPPFPADVLTDEQPVPQGFKKAIEVWQVKPELAAQAGVLVGAVAQMGLTFAKQNFPNGWRPATKVTAAETQMAIELLKRWQDGGVVFAGPETLPGIRAFRMTKHPKTAGVSTPPTPAPVNVPTGPTVPASVPPPVAAPQPPPGPPPFVPQAQPPQAPAGLQIVTVRHGEGLANLAARLGRPATGVSAQELRAANVPLGPDGVTWQKTNLNDKTTGGIKKLNRRGGLQPGDRLFVPAQWGLIDPGRL
jgi:hypothetical protein